MPALCRDLGGEAGSPDKRITVNLAPADIRKAGPSFDLPIAALAHSQSISRIFVPAADAPEADAASTPLPPYAADFAEIKGQEHVKRPLGGAMC